MECSAQVLSASVDYVNPKMMGSCVIAIFAADPPDYLVGPQEPLPL